MGENATVSSGSRITKELLETVLGEPVHEYKTQAGSNEGDNVASQLTSVLVTTSAQKTHHLLYKSFPDLGANAFHDEASLARITNFFTTEHMFYRSVVPLYESIVNTRLEEKVKASYILPFPKYFPNGFGLNDPKGLNTVWLKDLRPEGYKMMDKLEGLNFQETELVLTELGKFHAVTYLMVRQFGEKLFDEELAHVKVNGWLRPEIREEWQDMFAGHWKNTLGLVKGLGHDDWVARMKKIGCNDAFEVALRTAMGTDKKYFPVLVHGDLWTNNILFKFDQRNRPVSVKFVDFQLSRRGNIFEELVYFIYTSTMPQFREQHLRTVLCSYYNSFTGFLQALGCPRPINFTLGSLLDEFDANRKSAFMYMVFAIPLQLSTFSLGGDGDADKDQEQEQDPTQTPFVNMLYKMLKNSPPAMQRLEDITSEMIQLNVL